MIIFQTIFLSVLFNMASLSLYEISILLRNEGIFKNQWLDHTNDSWFTLKWLKGLLLQLVFICALICNYLVLTLGQVLGMEICTRDILMDHGQMGFKNYWRSQIITRWFTLSLIIRSLGRRVCYFAEADKEGYD